MTTDGRAGTITSCVTPEQAAAANGDTRSARAAAEKAAKGRCTFPAFAVSGDTVTYTMDCSGTVIESTATYHGDTMTGVLKTTRQGKSSTTTVRAHRLGACQGATK